MGDSTGTRKVARGINVVDSELFACVCVCVCVQGREDIKREGGGKKGGVGDG